MPPPLFKRAYPLAMVRPERLATVLEPMWNTRVTGNTDVSAATARWFAPGPTMFTLLETRSSPVVSRIVAGAGSKKLIVSPSAALASAARSVPGPLSSVLVTVIVVGYDQLLA